MVRRETKLNELYAVAENPETELDKIITKNKEYLHMMSENDLGSIYMLRFTGNRLCRLIPYSREDIASLVENEEVSPYDRIAELENTFAIVEYIFSKYNNEEY